VVNEQVEATIAEQETLTRELHHKLTKQLARIEQREQRLIDLAADGLLDRAKILERSNTIQLERQRIEASLTDTDAKLRLGAERLAQCLALVADPARLYADAPDETRRQLNRTFYKAFHLNDDPLTVVGNVLNPPFDEIPKLISPTNGRRKIP
jgi:hypothetical protein